MTTETQYPQPGPTGLPQFIRAEVERAIAKAVAPTGMSAHDGRALIGHDKLRYMLALIDSQAAKLAAIQAPEGAQALRAAAQQAFDLLTDSRWGTVPYMDSQVYEDAANAIRALRAALAAQRQAPAWQPIETAPKDEQLLLAVEFDGPGDWRIKTGYFYSEVEQWRVWGASWTPTHWMPLPAAPQTKEPTSDR